MHSVARCLVVLFLLAQAAHATESTRPWPGLREHTPEVHALVGATVIPHPGDSIPNATIIIRDGRIEAVGASVKVPADARVWKLDHAYVYPGLIDPYTHLGLSSGQSNSGGRGRGGSNESAPKAEAASYWNAKIRPDRSAAEAFREDTSEASALRALGVVAVLTVPEDGILSGTAAVVSTAPGQITDVWLKNEVALGAGFPTSSWDSDEYPGSLMGVMALFRQSFLDAEWHQKAHDTWSKQPTFEKPESIRALSELSRLRTAKTPVFFNVSDENMFLRAHSLATEFALPAVMRGSNYEYRRLDAIVKTGRSVILPLEFPKAPAVGTPEEALDVTLAQLRHWYLAPECAARLKKAGVKVAFTTDGLKDKSGLFKTLRTCIDRGLTETQALEALTVIPAELLGISDRYGTIAAGKSAGLVVASGPLFGEDTEILETWVEGERYAVTDEPKIDVRGTWSFSPHTASGLPASDSLYITGSRAKPKGTLGRKPEVKLGNLELLGTQVSFSFSGDSLGHPGVYRLTASVDSSMRGSGTAPDGTDFTWQARKTSDSVVTTPDTTRKKDEAGPKGRDTAEVPLTLVPRLPGGDFGYATPPAQEKLVAFTGATIWTSGEQGILENATLVVAEGKIVGVGAGLKPPGGARVVDATGLHITPGLIDCHSHTAIAGDVNEGTQTITAEVRIGDVIDPDDIGIYRELAGGLTAANTLHGSANAIGGQNQVIKLRWGQDAEGLKFAGAPPGIKFALGENPKQSNWGDNFTSRYPQTRMGVEQIIRDAFTAAKDYKVRREAYLKKSNGPPVRQDLELDALVEILDGKRLVHSHSYRQDEILMLTRVADDFGFKVATFQHVLEGYKVADRLAQVGSGASSFSDWWAYKFEVYDAIPQNGALMYDEGVVVSFNSDSGELARRLNTEAAKAVKYGGVPRADALKFVTLNPAKQLGISSRVGSLEPGKDADFVLWSGDPLSTYSHCQQTWVDGRMYFDRELDKKLQGELRQEKARLIQKVLASKDEGGGKDSRFGKKSGYSCSEHGGDHE